MVTENNYVYSPSRNAFYSCSMKDIYVNSSNGWPDDAIDVDDSTVDSMFEGQANGLSICAGSDGRPTLQKQKVVEPANESVRDSLIQDADAIIQPLMGYALAGIMSDADKKTFKAWNEYRKALEGLNVTANEIEWPDKPE